MSKYVVEYSKFDSLRFLKYEIETILFDYQGCIECGNWKIFSDTTVRYGKKEVYGWLESSDLSQPHSNCFSISFEEFWNTRSELIFGLGYYDKLRKMNNILSEWACLTGHNKCRHHPEILTELCRILDIPIKEPCQLPPRSEFDCGCQKYQDQLYRYPL